MCVRDPVPTPGSAMSFQSDCIEIGSSSEAEQNACGEQVRITSKFRGLYYDSKHCSWRVRIFYLGKQRHIGRYKDEQLAAQAYDRAAYFLYGTRANLNFRLKDVMADAQDVPASIRQAKEQGCTVRHPGPGFSSSSSSSTSSCSPHQSTQSLYGIGQARGAMGPSCLGRDVGPGNAVAHHRLQHPSQHQFGGPNPQHPQHQHQQQQQQQHYHLHASTSSQLLLAHQPAMLQPGINSSSAGAWQSRDISSTWLAAGQQQQQQQQMLAAAALAAAQAPGAHPMTQQAFVTLQQEQQLKLQQQQHQQQQQPGVFIPEVVASVVAALGLPAQPNAAGTAAAYSTSTSTSTSSLKGPPYINSMVGPAASQGLPASAYSSLAAPSNSSSSSTFLLASDPTAAQLQSISVRGADTGAAGAAAAAVSSGHGVSGFSSLVLGGGQGAAGLGLPAAGLANTYNQHQHGLPAVVGSTADGHVLMNHLYGPGRFSVLLQQQQQQQHVMQYQPAAAAAAAGPGSMLVAMPAASLSPMSVLQHPAASTAALTARTFSGLPASALYTNGQPNVAAAAAPPAPTCGWQQQSMLLPHMM